MSPGEIIPPTIALEIENVLLICKCSPSHIICLVSCPLHKSLLRVCSMGRTFFVGLVISCHHRWFLVPERLNLQVIKA